MKEENDKGKKSNFVSFQTADPSETTQGWIASVSHNEALGPGRITWLANSRQVIHT
jgi:hypothetical protein